MGFSRKEYWSGLPFAFPGHLPNLGIEPVSPALAGRFFTTEPPGKPKMIYPSTSIQVNGPVHSIYPLGISVKALGQNIVSITIPTPLKENCSLKFAF